MFLQCSGLDKPAKPLKMSWSPGIARVVSTQLEGLLGVSNLSMWRQVSPTKFMLKNYVTELQTDKTPQWIFK